jgi:hypothetical protein
MPRGARGTPRPHHPPADPHPDAAAQAARAIYGSPSAAIPRAHLLAARAPGDAGGVLPGHRGVSGWGGGATAAALRHGAASLDSWEVGCQEAVPAPPAFSACPHSPTACLGTAGPERVSLRPATGADAGADGPAPRQPRAAAMAGAAAAEFEAAGAAAAHAAAVARAAATGFRSIQTAAAATAAAAAYSPETQLYGSGASSSAASAPPASGPGSSSDGRRAGNDGAVGAFASQRLAVEMPAGPVVDCHAAPLPERFPPAPAGLATSGSGGGGCGQGPGGGSLRSAAAGVRRALSWQEPPPGEGPVRQARSVPVVLSAVTVAAADFVLV